ncbi:MAG: hypothetical protein LBC73_04985 [Oscillospiraceae bacterium]|jgi:hypothetical protein|nr:hypothetical protein [Oscillospiraceae bacterium]
MKNRETIKAEIIELCKTGDDLVESLKKYNKRETKEILLFVSAYEQWYSKALVVVKQLIPDRYNDFALLYRNDKRKNIDLSNYTICDALQSLSNADAYYIDFDGASKTYTPINAVPKLTQQVNMIDACCKRLDSKLYDMNILLQSEIFDSEIETTRHLLKNNHLRAAGAICGVILEAHLSSVVKNHNLKINKKAPSISDYNDILKDKVYDTIQWRFIQKLGDIRNLCVHKKEREPTKDDIDELINGTDKIVKTVF